MYAIFAGNNISFRIHTGFALKISTSRCERDEFVPLMRHMDISMVPKDQSFWLKNRCFWIHGGHNPEKHKFSCEYIPNGISNSTGQVEKLPKVWNLYFLYMSCFAYFHISLLQESIYSPSGCVFSRVYILTKNHENTENWEFSIIWSKTYQHTGTNTLRVCHSI